jgi:hypothetical protein
MADAPIAPSAMLFPTYSQNSSMVSRKQDGIRVRVCVSKV